VPIPLTRVATTVPIQIPALDVIATGSAAEDVVVRGVDRFAVGGALLEKRDENGAPSLPSPPTAPVRPGLD
jgi:hypothetical protein